MRLSIKSDDPGYMPDIRGVNVYLNGEIVKGVLTADEELGVVVAHSRNEAGQHVIFGGHLAEQTLQGKVRIDLPDDHPLRARWAAQQKLSPIPATSYTLASDSTNTWLPAWDRNQLLAYGASEARRTTLEERESNAPKLAVANELLAELITCRHDLARMLGELRQSVTVPDTDTIPDQDDEALCQFEETRIARLDALIAKAQGALKP